jgi:hypothetical protein
MPGDAGKPLFFSEDREGKNTIWKVALIMI